MVMGTAPQLSQLHQTQPPTYKIEDEEADSTFSDSFETSSSSISIIVENPRDIFQRLGNRVIERDSPNVLGNTILMARNTSSRANITENSSNTRAEQTVFEVTSRAVSKDGNCLMITRVSANDDIPVNEGNIHETETTDATAENEQYGCFDLPIRDLQPSTNAALETLSHRAKII